MRFARNTPHASQLLAMVLLMGCGALIGDQATVGGETHFLITCEQGCGEGLSCIEGACTRACEPGYSSCTELSAAAACVGVPEEAAERVAFRGTCDVQCASDADCAVLGAEFTCRTGACRAAPGEALSATGSTSAPLVRAVDAATCVSGLSWAGGDTPSAEMHPGSDCVECHRDTGARPLLFGGTLYMDANGSNAPWALDGCFGLEGVEVIITDSAGREFSAVTNRAGNFYHEGSESDWTTPYVARFLWQSQSGRPIVTPMASTPQHGGCARCHGNPTPPTGPFRLDSPDPEWVSPTPEIFLPGLYPRP